MADRSPISSSRIRENLEKTGLRIRYQGRVQGVGFRPTVWHLARKLSLTGSVFNDRSGAVVPADQAEIVLSAMRAHSAGQYSCPIGVVSESPKGRVILQTAFGGERVVDVIYGEQLPRIC